MPTRRQVFVLAGGMLATRAAQAQTQTQTACPVTIGADHLIEAGKWQMSINPTLPPQQFIDANGELQGLNVELARLMAARLCLEPVFLRMDFPAMIPALRAARFDTINTGLFWTEERSKLFFLVPYAQQAISVFTLPDSAMAIAGFDDLAGHQVGVESSTYQERKSREIAAAMTARGLAPIDFHLFATASEMVAALRAGQLDGAITIDDTASDLVTRKIAKIRLHGLFGTDITFAFRDGVLAEAAAEALTALKAGGEYDRLFTKFAMTPLAGDRFAIRGPGPA